MRRFPLAPLFLILPCVLHAQAVQAPPFRLTQDAVAAAAQRIDDAALAFERTFWERRMSRTPPADRVPLEIPPQTDDFTFLRRVSLDLHARLPGAKTVREFLADADPAKRAKLVDRLLHEPESGARRFTRLADMLRVKDEVLGVSFRPFIAWLQDACAQSMPYDEMVRAMITAAGEVTTNPATGWLLRDGGRMTVATTEAFRVFLDEEISCARCHDHPFSDWTQMQFYEIAAWLGGAQVIRLGPQNRTLLWPPASWNDVEVPPLAPDERLLLMDARGNPPLLLPPDYKYRDGKTGDVVGPRLLGWRGAELSKDKVLRKVSYEKLRGAFADWMTRNHRFELVAALRTWHELFGVPAQDASSIAKQEEHEPQMRPQLLGFRTGKACEYTGGCGLPSWAGGETLVGPFIDRQNDLGQRRLGEVLVQEFLRASQDLREFERILCRTAVYRRESIAMDLGALPQFRAPVIRRLRPETIWNNLLLVQTDGASGSGRLSHELPQVPDANHPARVLGRGVRERGDESVPLITHSLVRLMMNGEPTKLGSDAESALVRRLRVTQPADVAVDEAFLAVLGRFPSHDEKMKAMDHGIANPATVWSDLVWALLNTGEFLFQR